MIYVDTSVVLAHVLAEDRRPPDSLWDDVLVASTLVEYETWVRLHRAGLGESHAAVASATLGRLRLVSLDDDVVRRAKEPFPVPVRTLDALHLATALYLNAFGPVRLATYDARMLAAAVALSIQLAPL